jgi:DNA-binding HxlR family transcriptional regulator
MRRRDGDGCPVASALQLLGDKWTLLVVRDLQTGPKRTTELLEALHPISSRTLVDRLRDMERDDLIVRIDYGGSPPRVEYTLTERGHLLSPLLDALRLVAGSLGCGECDDRRTRTGSYCDACPHNAEIQPRNLPRRRDESIVLL